MATRLITITDKGVVRDSLTARDVLCPSRSNGVTDICCTTDCAAYQADSCYNMDDSESFLRALCSAMPGNRVIGKIETKTE